MRSPTVLKRINDIKSVPVGNSSEEFRKIILLDFEVFGRIITKANSSLGGNYPEAHAPSATARLRFALKPRLSYQTNDASPYASRSRVALKCKSAAMKNSSVVTAEIRQ